MREKRDMAGRDLARRGLAPLCHPAVLLGMDHAILGPKERPRGQGLPCWAPGFRLEDTGIGSYLSYRQSSCLHRVNVVGEVLGEDIWIDPGKTLPGDEQMPEDFQGRKLGAGTEQRFPFIKDEGR